jgi:hypothetical protein
MHQHLRRRKLRHSCIATKSSAPASVGHGRTRFRGSERGPCFTREARGFLKRMLIDMPDQKQVRSLSCKGMCNAASDATAGAGNERDLSFQFPHRLSTNHRTYRLWVLQN